MAPSPLNHATPENLLESLQGQTFEEYSVVQGVKCLQTKSPAEAALPPPPPPSPVGSTVDKFRGNDDDDDGDTDINLVAVPPAGIYAGLTPNMSSTPTKRWRNEDRNDSVPATPLSASKCITPVNEETLSSSATGTPCKRPRHSDVPCATAAAAKSTGVIGCTPVKRTRREDIDPSTDPSSDRMKSPVKRPRVKSTTTTTTTTTATTTTAAAAAAPVDGLGGASAGRCNDHTGLDSAANCGFVCFDRTGLCLSPLPPHMWECSNTSELIMGTSAASLDDSNFAFGPVPPPAHTFKDCPEQDTVECGVCNVVLERATYKMI